MYYAKQVEPEFQEDPLFQRIRNELDIEDDFLKGNIAIYGNREYMSLENENFKKALNFECLWYEYENFKSCGFGNISEFFNYYFKKSNGENYTPKEIHRWKELFEKYTYFKDVACEILELITDMEWREETIRGCAQREWQTIYVSEQISDEDIEYIEMCYFNTGSEYLVYKDNEEEYLCNVYVKGYDVRKEIAQELGCAEKEVKVFNVTGYTRIPKYEEVE